MKVENGTVNAFHCMSCGYAMRQYTNATSHTVRGDAAILAASATRPYWDEPDEGSHTFRPTFDIDVVHGNHEDLVASLHVRRYGEDKPLYSRGVHFSPAGDRIRYKVEVPVPIDVFPDDTDLFAIDVLVQNAWGEELDRVRRVSNTVRVR